MAVRPAMHSGRHGFNQQQAVKLGKEQRGVLWRLVRLVLKHYRLSLLAVVVCIIVSSATTLTSTLFTRTLIDGYIVPLTQSALPDYSALGAALLRLGVILSLGVSCSYAYNRLMINVSQGTMLRLRKQLFTRMEQLPVGYFDMRAHGDIMSLYTNDIDSLRQAIGSSLPSLLSSTVTIVVTFASMVVLSLPLTLVSMAMAAAMFYVTKKLGNRSRKFFREQQKSLADTNAFIEEMVGGQKVIKVFCHEQEAIRRFEQINQRLLTSASRANATANIVMPVNGNLGIVGYVFIGVIGAMLALEGNVALTVGTLVSFLTLNKSFTQPVTHISQQLNSMLNAVVGAERIFALADAETETDEGDITLGHDGKGNPAWITPQGECIKTEGDVDFQGVDFGYTTGKTVLFDININTSPGQKIAFVGGTGAGKTTIINLINRFYDVNKGEIRYDGLPITSIRKADLRRSLGIVLQQTNLFSTTVMENIRYGRVDATDEECRQAARMVGADGFIRRLAQGYDTKLQTNGSNLSQGERQLLAIARVAVANPPVLILDEATSSIDTHTERIVQDGMDRLMQGRTTFVIAHRLSTVRNANIIIVMEQGRIIEQGTHDSLMKAEGRYYQLYTGAEL